MRRSWVRLPSSPPIQCCGGPTGPAGSQGWQAHRAGRLTGLAGSQGWQAHRSSVRPRPSPPGGSSRAPARPPHGVAAERRPARTRAPPARTGLRPDPGADPLSPRRWPPGGPRTRAPRAKGSIPAALDQGPARRTPKFRGPSTRARTARPCAADPGHPAVPASVGSQPRGVPRNAGRGWPGNAADGRGRPAFSAADADADGGRSCPRPGPARNAGSAPGSRLRSARPARAARRAGRPGRPGSWAAP